MSDFSRNVRAVFASILSDTSIISLLLLAAVFYSFFYTAAYQTQVAEQLPIAIVDLDQSALSRQLIRSALASQSVQVKAYPSSLLEAKKILNRGEVDGILLLPANFENNAFSLRPATALVYSNNSFLLRNSTILKGLVSVLGNEAEQLVRLNLYKAGKGIATEKTLKSLSAVKLIPRPLFNTREGYGSYALGGVAQLIVQQTLMFGMVALLGQRSYRARHLQQNMANRFMLPNLFFSHVFVFFLIGMANILYFNGFAFWWQDYPRAGNIPGMITFSAVFILAIVMFTLFVASFFDRTYRALQILGLTSLPIFFLSGLSWPQRDIPFFLYWPAQLLPSTAGINGYVKLNQMGASLAEVSSELLTLGFIIVVFGAASFFRWVSRPDSTQPALHADQRPSGQ